MISRRAAVQISMSWIFMFVIGTFFLIFTYNVIDAYRENEESKFELKSKNYFRSILNSVGRTEGVEDTLVEPIIGMFRDKKVEFECLEGEIPLLVLNGEVQSSNEYLKNYPVFMTSIEPRKIDDSFMLIESFRMPFKITNVLAFVSQKNLILFDENSQTASKLYDKFRLSSYYNLEYRIIDLENPVSFEGLSLETSEKKFDSIVIAGDNVLDLEIDSLEAPAIVLVEFEASSNLKGVLTLKDKEGEEKSFSYLDTDKSLTLQTMAVFSTPEAFECSYSLLMEKLRNSYEFYLTKSKYFEEEAKEKQICSPTLSLSEQQDLYTQVSSVLEGVKEELEISDDLSSDALSNALGLFQETHSRLEAFNCPYIY